LDKAIIVDTDIASAFAKIERLNLLLCLFSNHSIYITPRIFEELSVSHIPQEDRSKYHHFSCHRFEILKSNVLIISEIFIKDILHFHDLAGYMLAHCTWHEHE